MIIRGAAGRKMPYGRLNIGDKIYFINNNGEGLIKASGTFDNVFNSGKMSKEESKALVENNQDKLQLTDKQFKRWAGKRYLVLIKLRDIATVDSFEINRSEYGNMDDWLLVEDIESVKK